jgi:hypothetical protein
MRTLVMAAKGGPDILFCMPDRINWVADGPDSPVTDRQTDKEKESCKQTVPLCREQAKCGSW